MALNLTNDNLSSSASMGAPLIRFPNGRYGYQRSDQRIVEFTCGYPVDVLVRDGNTLSWISTRFEHDGQDYYLVGCPDVPLGGLIVRERRNIQ